MELRDRAEEAIRRLHALEAKLGGDPIIDYDYAPGTGDAVPYPHRLAALDELTDLAEASGPGPVLDQLTAHATYLSAVLGEQRPLDDYLMATQGCRARGWSDDYLDHRRDLALDALVQLGIGWGEGHGTTCAPSTTLSPPMPSPTRSGDTPPSTSPGFER